MKFNPNDTDGILLYLNTWKASSTSTGNAARKRVSRRLTFDEDKSSPVSGTLIRELADGEEIPMYQTGKID